MDINKSLCLYSINDHKTKVQQAGPDLANKKKTNDEGYQYTIYLCGCNKDVVKETPKLCKSKCRALRGYGNRLNGRGGIIVGYK